MAVPVEFTQVRFRCPTCRRSWASKSRAAKHVPECHKDPEVRACSTCKHDIRDEQPVCWIEARPDYETIKRHCDQWEAK